jgi:DNA-binding GntR family transcriptional regulator
MQRVDVRGDRNTLADLAYKAILNAILSHELKPGDSLYATDLATLLSISRTPIQRALERLAGEGIVEMRPGKGPQVPEPTISEILELHEVRLMLELFAVQEGIAAVDTQFLARMETLIEQHAAAGAALDGTYEATRASLESNRRFHNHLMSLWNNKKAQAWYNQVNLHIKAFLLFSTDSVYRISSLDEHLSIHQALQKQDVSAATLAVRQHLIAAREHFLTRVRSAGVER